MSSRQIIDGFFLKLKVMTLHPGVFFRVELQFKINKQALDIRKMYIILLFPIDFSMLKLSWK